MWLVKNLVTKGKISLQRVQCGLFVFICIILVYLITEFKWHFLFKAAVINIF